MDMGVIYQLRDIQKSYNREWSLEIDELDIFEGEILCIVGPNGAGKSTLLRLLHFLDEPDRGEFRYRGSRMKYPVSLDIRRGITMVFQKPIMFVGSVSRNISFGPRLQGVSHPRRMEKLMVELDLIDLQHVSAKELSGGEKQRVALGRALALKTNVLLLDEPGANLDPNNIVLIEAIIRQLQEAHQTTIVLVTHNIAQAKRLADRVAFLFDGQLVEVGDAADFFQNPADPRSKAYLQHDLTV